MIAIMSYAFFEALLARAAAPRQYAAGAHVFHREDAVRSFHLLVEGGVSLVRHQEDGGALVLHAMRGPHVIAEASLYSKTYHCDCICDSDCAVAALPATAARELLRRDASLAEEWSAYLARELQNARRHAEILTHGKVASRLDAWIGWHGPLPEKGEWKALARQLSISPEALYREIGRRRNRGGKSG